MTKSPNAAKSEEQLVSELAEARRRIGELETLAAERESAAEALRVSEERYRALAENIDIGLTLIDRDHRVILANAMQGRIFHKPPGEFIGKNCFEEFEKRDAVCPHCPGVQAIATGQPAVVETTGVRDDGSVNFARIQAFPVLNAEGTPIGFVEMVEDISDRRQAEEALARRAMQLQTGAEVAHAASSIVDPNELMHQVVDLIRERLDLYYVGLFLIGHTGLEPGKWAVLRAGTGEAGRKMLQKGYKLKIGSGSMVGSCIASNEPIITLDAGEAVVRIANPLLPDTRSEMALPLISRGEAIGALTIQSSREAAFGETDIAVLQIMAGQIANSIENARLYKETQEALERLEAVHRSYVRQEWRRYLGRSSSPDKTPESG